MMGPLQHLLKQLGTHCELCDGFGAAFLEPALLVLKRNIFAEQGVDFPSTIEVAWALATLKALNQTSAEKVSKSADPFLVNDVIKIKQTDLSARNLIE